MNILVVTLNEEEVAPIISVIQRDIAEYNTIFSKTALTKEIAQNFLEAEMFDMVILRTATHGDNGAVLCLSLLDSVKKNRAYPIVISTSRPVWERAKQLEIEYYNFPLTIFDPTRFLEFQKEKIK